jgi:FkbM family methyltransferase
LVSQFVRKLAQRAFQRLGGIRWKLGAYKAALGGWGPIRFIFWKLTGTARLFRAKLAGIEAPVFIRLGTTDMVVLSQVFTERQYDLALPFTPKVIIDAGANIGLSAVFFANKYPEALVVAVEPEPSNYDMLLKNSAAHPNITPVRAALWKEPGQLKLEDPGEGHYGFKTAALTEGVAVDGRLVQAMTVEDVLSRIGATAVDILKLDVEGAEKEVLENSAGWIGKVKVIMAELHERTKPGCTQVFAEATASFRDEFAKGEILIRVSNAEPPEGRAVRRWR